MKVINCFIFLFFLLKAEFTPAQQLTDLYAKPVIRLQADENYGNKNNWEEIFYDYNKTTSNGRPIGKSKEIIVAPDGSVFMSDKTTYSIAKFDKDGNFVKRFGKKGGKKHNFLYDPSISGILDNRYVVTQDVQGRVQLFTLDGDFYRLVQLDFSPSTVVPLKNSCIAISGFVPMSGGKAKQLVMIKNVETGSAKIIWQDIRENEFAFKLNTPKAQYVKPLMPFSGSYYSRPQLAAGKTGHLLIAFPQTGEILEYTADGKKLKSFKADITPLPFTDEDAQIYKKNLEKSLDGFFKSLNEAERENEKNKTMKKVEAEMEKQRENQSLRFPYFSSFMVDNEGHLLLFLYTDKETNQMKVYTLDKEGKSIATTSFQCDDYDLSFLPSKFAFHNGSVYAVGMLKEGGGDLPLRIVRFKLL